MARSGDPPRSRPPSRRHLKAAYQGPGFPGGLILVVVLLLGAAWAFGQGGPGEGATPLEAYPTLGWWEALVVLALIAGNAIVCAVEAALEVLKPFHAKALRDSDQDAAADHLQHLLDFRLRYIAATAFGNQVCRFLLFLVSVTLAPPLAAEFRVRWGAMAALIIATLIVLIPILLVNMIVELVSQSYGALHAHRVALRYFKPIKASAVVFALPTAIVTGLGNLIAKRFGGTASFTIANRAEEEIKTIVETAEGTGEIESDEKQLLHSVFEFTDTVVRDGVCRGLRVRPVGARGPLMELRAEKVVLAAGTLENSKLAIQAMRQADASAATRLPIMPVAP